MAGVTYDREIMNSMRRSFQSLRLGAYVPRLAQLVAVGGVKLTMDCFRKQSDPYGRAWQPLARERARDRRARLRVEARGQKSRGQKILIHTARMKNSTTAIHVGRSGGVAIPTGYAAVHQDGARIAPHTQLASLSNATYRVRGRFASGAQAERAAAKGKKFTRAYYNRTYLRDTVIPRRMMLPDQKMGLPANWVRMTQKEAVGLLTRWVSKGARA